MSTRCQIGFYEPGEKDLGKFEALIYRHMDGYPGKADGSEYGALADIVPILQDFKKNRGLDDVEYASAWLVAKLKDGYLNIGISKDFLVTLSISMLFILIELRYMKHITKIL